MKFLRAVKEIFLYIWQLPQNLIGFIYSRFTKDIQTFKTYPEAKVQTSFKVYYVPCFKAGVTLGQYIILDPVWKTALKTGRPKYLYDTACHEFGHTRQSRYLGVLYLFIVGVPSVVRNILNRANSKKFNQAWYYSGYPENWADTLGGVKR